MEQRAVYRKLYPYFDRKFISDSYSCRKGKGTHKALNCFRAFAYVVSKNHTKMCWVLKCDIQKFFPSIDQSILINIVTRHINNQDITNLIDGILRSFNVSELGKGLPLGNLTSQLLVNTYMNEFDQFAKHRLKAKHYIRYADDFVFLSHDRQWLVSLIPHIANFLDSELALTFHPKKVEIKTFASGVDFLGWVHFHNHRILRTTTKRKMFREIKAKDSKKEIVQSYLGLLSHGNTNRLQAEVERMI